MFSMYYLVKDCFSWESFSSQSPPFFKDRVKKAKTRVSIRKTFAERNAKFFFLCASVKNNNLHNNSQKSFCKLCFSALAKLKFCTIPQLEFCAILQFRKNQTVGDGVCFLEFNSGKIYVLE